MKKYAVIITAILVVVLSLVIGCSHNLLFVPVIGAAVGVFAVNLAISDFKFKIIDLISAIIAGIIVLVIWRVQ